MISSNNCPPSSNANPRQLIILLLQGAVVQINEGLYCRSPRLATRFKSNAANIAKVLVTALFKSNFKVKYSRNSGSKNQLRSHFLRFLLKHSSSKQQKLATGGYTTMLLVANCLVSFL